MVKIKTGRQGIEILIQDLQNDYRVIGPKVEGGTQVYTDIQGLHDFPMGLEDHHQPGRYELLANGTKSLFQVLSGPQSAKNFLFPPKRKIFSVHKDEKNGFKINDESCLSPTKKLALFGLRSCELSAIDIQDKVFGSQKFQDENYTRLRKEALIIAVNCSRYNSSCFCTSMGGGPRAQNTADIRITEILDDQDPWYLLESDTDSGKTILKKLTLGDQASASDIKSAFDLVEKNVQAIPKRNIPKDIKNLLYAEQTSSVWEEIGQKCLSCANCTMVCPTCFCTTVEEVNDVSGKHSERWLKWESCFTSDHSLMHGKPHRQSVGSRYRQWMTHKLASWQDQFGSSGCTGCGKCVTWCPVGIDITSELSRVHQLKQNQDE